MREKEYGERGVLGERERSESGEQRVDGRNVLCGGIL